MEDSGEIQSRNGIYQEFCDQGLKLKCCFTRLNEEMMGNALDFINQMLSDMNEFYTQVTSQHIGGDSASISAGVPLCCVFCGETFISYLALNEHITNHLSDNSSPTESGSPRPNKRKPMTPRKSVDYYNEASDSSDTRTIDQSDRPIPRKRVKKVTTAEDVNCSLVTDFKGDERYQCDQCELKFSYYAALLRHLDAIHKSIDASEKIQQINKKAVQCDQCGATLSSKGALHAHMHMHSGEQPHTCETCGKKFSLKSNLLRHARIHKGVKPYSCDICGKRFTEKRSVEVHRRIHTGERPYNCAVCGMKFSQLGSWIGHKDTHKETCNEWKCEKCGKTFTQKQGLENHKKRTHEQLKTHQCTTCTQAFHTDDELRSHSTSHTGEKSFLCSSCGKGFSRRSALNNHLTTCTPGDYNCDKCSSTFTSQLSLNRHVKSQHSKKTSDPILDTNGLEELID